MKHRPTELLWLSKHLRYPPVVIGPTLAGATLCDVVIAVVTSHWLLEQRWRRRPDTPIYSVII